MSAFVIDASAFGALIVPDEKNDLIPGLIDLLGEKGALAPQHWRLEIANLALMAVRRQRLAQAELPGLLAAAQDADVVIDDETHSVAWGATLDLALAHGLTVYDAAYLELAKRSGLPMATLDRRLADAARREGVELLGS